jgi:hypothetical protein
MLFVIDALPPEMRRMLMEAVPLVPPHMVLLYIPGFAPDPYAYMPVE